MIKLPVILFLILLSLCTYSQDVLCGRVIDENTKEPIEAMVFLSNAEDHILTDSLGSFCLKLDSTKIVYISSPSYSLYKLNVHESYSTIEMSVAKMPANEYPSSNNYYLTDRDNPLTGFSPSFSASFLKTDYSEFENTLGSEVVEVLETTGTLKFELAGYTNRLYLGIGYGIGQRTPQEEEEDNLQANSGHFSVNVGYNLINKRVILTPHIGYFSYRNRIRSKEENATLNEYLGNRGIDLKFVGYFAKAGLDLHYVINESFDHTFLGVRVSYLQQIGDTVIKNNFGDKLSSDNNVNFSNLNVEFILTIFTNSIY